tara:strand:- start:326 stop:433 length:108 start_codon:yes stop_codon:yes gene_type:complete
MFKRISEMVVTFVVLEAALFLVMGLSVLIPKLLVG